MHTPTFGVNQPQHQATSHTCWSSNSCPQAWEPCFLSQMVTLPHQCLPGTHLPVCVCMPHSEAVCFSVSLTWQCRISRHRPWNPSPQLHADPGVSACHWHLMRRAPFVGALRPLMPPGEWEWLADRWVGLQAMVVVGHSQALPTPNSTTLSFQK